MTIRQLTSYPAETEVTFEVTVPKPVHFTLRVRRPKWAESVSAGCDFSEKPGCIAVEREWNGTQKGYQVRFSCSVKIRTDFCRDAFVLRGSAGIRPAH